MADVEMSERTEKRGIQEICKVFEQDPASLSSEQREALKYAFMGVWNDAAIQITRVAMTNSARMASGLEPR